MSISQVLVAKLCIHLSLFLYSCYFEQSAIPSFITGHFPLPNFSPYVLVFLWCLRILRLSARSANDNSLEF